MTEDEVEVCRLVGAHRVDVVVKVVADLNVEEKK